MSKLNPIDLQKALKDVDYPASKDDLVKGAERNGAGDDVMAALKGLGDHNYTTPADVTEAVSFATKDNS